MSVDIFVPNLAAPRGANLGEVCFSDPATLNLCIYRGDTGVFRVTVTYADGQPIDVSSATWDADIRTSAAATTTLGSLVVTPVPGEPSKVDVAIPAATSAALPPNTAPAPVWDLQMTLAGQVQTLLKGSVTVTGDVSRTP